MISRQVVSVCLAGLLGLAGSVAVSVANASLVIERFQGDASFDARCDGTACIRAEAVAQAGGWSIGTSLEDMLVPGPRALALGVPKARTEEGLAGGAGEAPFAWLESIPFRLAYDASERSLTYAVFGSRFGFGQQDVVLTAGVDLSDATSIFLRTQAPFETTRAALHELTFNGEPLGASLSATSPSQAAFLAFAGFDPTADWMLAGTVQVQTDGVGPLDGVRFLMTDATVVPLPGAVGLLLSGIAGLGYMRHRQHAPNSPLTKSLFSRAR